MYSPKTLEDAKAAMAELSQRWASLHEASDEADANGEICFWCCGGGDDEWDGIKTQEALILKEFPELEPLPEWVEPE